MPSPWPEGSAFAWGDLVCLTLREGAILCGRRLLSLMKFVDLLDQLQKLLLFALAHVQETNAYLARFVKSLGNTGKTPSQPS